ncbi:MAG: hypothetical protein Q4G63_13145 [Bacteroidia bacterium]|nr:hypothetical protein [Bacteroidia bacterium]
MKVVFTFWIGGNSCMDLEIKEWPFSFLPAVGDEVLLYDYFNEADFDFAKSTLIDNFANYKIPYDNLIELLFDCNIFEVSKMRWIDGGVEIALEENSIMERWNFKLKMPNEDAYQGKQLRNSILVHSEAMNNFIYKNNQN